MRWTIYALRDKIIITNNLEKAKQYTQAIVAYREAVADVTTISELTEEATSSLLRLQKAHPNAATNAETLSSHTSSLSNG